MATGLLSPAHIALVLIVALMVFGAKRLPEIGKSLGTGLRDFKQSLEGTTEKNTPHLAIADPVATPVEPTTAGAPSPSLESVSRRAERDAAA